MDQWDEAVEQEERENRVRALLDGQGLILFFKKGKGLYGAPEESRVTFARMMDPVEGEEDFMDQATFMAINLLDALSSDNGSQMVFTLKDLPKIKVVPRDKCEKIMLKHASKPVKVKGKVGDAQGDDHGYIKIDDEE